MATKGGSDARSRQGQTPIQQGGNMNKRILRSRLLGSTAAFSILLGTISPVPLGAQTVQGNADRPDRLTRENCQNEDESACSPAEFREQRRLLQERRAQRTQAREQAAEDGEGTPPDDEPDIETTPDPAPTPEPLQVPPPPPPAEAPEAPVEVPAPDVAPAPDSGDQPVMEGIPEPEATVTPDPEPDTVVTDGAQAAPATLPVATAEAIETLTSILTDEPDDTEAAAPRAAATTGTEPAPGATSTTITEEDSRSSSEEFSQPSAAVKGADDRGLSTLQKVGLVALGALAVGAILNARGDQVVENSGDRVVVRRNDGNFYVLKDDDTLLRQPGSTVQTETYSDGSTRSIVLREDGKRIVTIRDASGRVLRRTRVDLNGRETVLIDDISPVEPVDVSVLPAPRPDFTISTRDDGASLRAALAQMEARENARVYSLRQIRDLRQVRALAPTIQINAVTFATGSAAIRADEAEKLAELGRLLADLVRARPNEIFLIEGHTDAIGSASSNLALSDRRAESVALALTEYFGVPPENLVVQGYGEGDLLIPTEAAEVRNRRVAVRLITPIMSSAALR